MMTALRRLGLDSTIRVVARLGFAAWRLTGNRFGERLASRAASAAGRGVEFLEYRPRKAGLRPLRPFKRATHRSRAANNDDRVRRKLSGLNDLASSSAKTTAAFFATSDNANSTLAAPTGLNPAQRRTAATKRPNTLLNDPGTASPLCNQGTYLTLGKKFRTCGLMRL